MKSYKLRVTLASGESLDLYRSAPNSGEAFASVAIEFANLGAQVVRLELLAA
jgi:hypothetical protein